MDLSLFISAKIGIAVSVATGLLVWKVLSRPRRAQVGLPVREVVIFGPDRIERGRLAVEVARTWRQQQIGLMFRTVVPEGRGMYFPMPWRGHWPMHMVNTLAPLDILHFDRGVLVSVVSADPLQRRLVGFARRSDAVIEARRGWVVQHGVVVGDTLEFAVADESKARRGSGSALSAAVAAVVFLCCVMSGGALAQSVQRGDSPAPGEQPVPRTVGMAVDESRFVTLISRLAGAESVCHPELVVPMRLCGEFMVSHWHEITGGNPAQASEEAVYPVIWSHGFSMAAKRQKAGSGLSCPDLDQDLFRSGIAGYCSHVRSVLVRSGG